jgi:ankyrin repeat protein
MCAVRSGLVEMCALLIERGADLNIRDSETGCTALHWSVKGGRTDICALLLQHGADPDILENASSFFKNIYHYIDFQYAFTNNIPVA